MPFEPVVNVPGLVKDALTFPGRIACPECNRAVIDFNAPETNNMAYDETAAARVRKAHHNANVFGKS